MLRKTQLHLGETKDHGEASVSVEAAPAQQPHCSGVGETPLGPWPALPPLCLQFANHLLTTVVVVMPCSQQFQK